MRKTLLLLALCTSACSSLPNAARAEPLADAPVFIDVDGDGLPDAMRSQGEFVDVDGDGLPDKRVTPTNSFVDTNGDGLPDTRVFK